MARYSARRRDAALAIAQFGLAQTFFGNLYEAVARIPDRIARERDLAAPAGGGVALPALLRPGSPVRYHLPVGPVVVGATATALVSTPPEGRRWSAASAAATLAAVAGTAYTVRVLNGPLFFAADPPRDAEREVLLRRWYALNAVRMAATAVAWAAARRARSGP